MNSEPSWSLPPVPPPGDPRLLTVAPEVGCRDIFLGVLLAIGIFIANLVIAVPIGMSGGSRGNDLSQAGFMVLAGGQFLVAVGGMFFVKKAIRSGRLATWLGLVLGCALGALLDSVCLAGAFRM